MNKLKWLIVVLISLLLTGCGSLPASKITQTTEIVEPTRQITFSPTTTTVLLTATLSPTDAPTQEIFTPIPASDLLGQLPSGSYIIYRKVKTIDDTDILSL